MERENGNPMIGKTLLHYKVVSQIGKGGMGEVYVAEDTKLGRRVALKILPSEVAADAERRKRFEREAKAVAALNHPNIVTMFSVEEVDGIHFTTMELVVGETLTTLIPEKHGFPLSQLLNRAIDLADAVSAAHRQGITHRDLKPDNVMVSDEGRLKVLDFGLAKFREDAPDVGAGTQLPTESMTQEGKILGTVAYMSPEQAEGKPADARSDIFSLGIILYQMASGRRPFKGDTPMSTISMILRETPASITELNPNLPRHLGRIVKRCLEKDPERRYQTAQDLRNDLQGLREELDSGELPVPSRAAAPAAGRSSVRWLGIAAALLVVAAIAYFVSQRLSSGPQAPGARAMEITRLTSSGNAAEAAISPDGNYVAHEVRVAGRDGLAVTHVTTGSSVEIVAPSDASIVDPTFAPQGDFVYYILQPEEAPFPSLYRVPVLGGASRKILEQVNERISFSPDGSRFVFVRHGDPIGSSKLIVADADGRNEHVITTRTHPDSYRDPAWSPDGTVIAAGIETFAGGVQATVVVVPAEGGAEREILSGSWWNVGEIAWLPDGSGLVLNAQDKPMFLASQIWELSYPAGEARRITNDLNFYEGVSVNGDGTALVTVQQDLSADLWVVTPEEGAEPFRVTSSSRTFDGFGVTWIGEDRIVYASNAAGPIHLWSIGADGGDPVQLTSEAHNHPFPVASADGRYLMFPSDRAGGVNIWRMEADGSNLTQITDGAFDVEPSISPDGQWVVYTGGSNSTLLKVSVEGGEPEEILDRWCDASKFSPDGTQIAVRNWHEDEKKWKVDLIPFQGGEPTGTLEIRGNYEWSPDGRAITYADGEGGVENIWSQPLDGGEPRQLTHFEKDWIGWHAWAPDGKRLVVSRGQADTDVVLIRNFR